MFSRSFYSCEYRSHVLFFVIVVGFIVGDDVVFALSCFVPFSITTTTTTTVYESSTRNGEVCLYCVLLWGRLSRSVCTKSYVYIELENSLERNQTIILLYSSIMTSAEVVRKNSPIIIHDILVVRYN